MRALVLLVLAATLLLPGPAASDPVTGTSFFFAVPDATTGTVGVGATFDFGAENECSFRTVSSGPSAPSPIHIWEEWSTWGDGAFYSTFTTHGHVAAPLPGVTVDSREVKGRGGLWSLESISSGPYSGVMTFVHVIPAAGAWDSARGHYPPFVLDVQCERPFSVGGFLRGDEALAFTPDSMRGSAGAGVTQLFGSASVLRDASASATFTGDEVRFRVRSNVWTGHTDGEVRLDGPMGLRAWDLTQTDDDTASDTIRIRETFGPGAYTVGLDYTSVGLDETLLGIVYSLSPVPTLSG